MTKDNDTPIDELNELLWGYLQGELSEEQMRSFVQLLKQDTDAAHHCAEQVELWQMTRDLFQKEGAAIREISLDASADDSAAVIALAEIEADSEPGARSLESISKAAMFEPVPSCTDDQLSGKQIAEVLWYLASQPKVWAPLAAAVALTASLLVVFIFVGGPSNNPQLPNLTNTPIEQGPRDLAGDQGLANPIVATLTAEHDAVWDRRPGEDLFAGQRLTLTEGFAEITTVRGAVAVLEAPATIRFFNHDNALELESGKLVANCQTKQSKGFVVYAPNAQIVDIGTQFGVAVSDSGQTVAKVFEGEVELTAMTNGKASSEPLTLLTEQAKAVDPTGMQVSDADPLGLTFFGKHLLDLESQPTPQADYERWRTQSQAIRRDPSVVLYYPFDDKDHWAGVLMNRAASKPGQFDGKINGPTWADGRFPGKRALRFRTEGPTDSLGQHVEVLGSRSDELDFHGQSFSIAVWFKGGDIQQSLRNFMPLVTRGDESWRLQSYKDQMNLTWDIDSEGFVKDHSVVTDSEPFDGDWHFVVAVVEADPESGHTTHRVFVDGQQERLYQIDQKRLVSSAPVMLGANSDQVDHRFDGLIDEAVIFSRALSPQEVRAMHRLTYEFQHGKEVN